MKIKLLLLFVLVLGFIAYIAYGYYTMTKKDNFGRLRIVSTPAAAVVIDNATVGKTPFEDKFAVGEYLIKLIPEGEVASTSPWSGKAKVYKNALTYVNRELGSSELISAGEIMTLAKIEKKPKQGGTGEISVETEPVGAIVYLDNDEKGVTSLLMEDVPAGDHELSVFMPGFFRRTQKINVEPGYRVFATFKLALDESNKPLEQIIEEKRKEASEEAKRREEASQIKTVVIQKTPTGFLRVRFEPSTSASESARVKPGEVFPLLEETTGWYKIKVAEVEGWVSAQYAKIEITKKEE